MLTGPTRSVKALRAPWPLFTGVLGPLYDKGGPPPTHTLLAGSPALDAREPAARESSGTAGAAWTGRSGAGGGLAHPRYRGWRGRGTSGHRHPASHGGRRQHTLADHYPAPTPSRPPVLVAP
jgi:hypothetical protein